MQYISLRTADGRYALHNSKPEQQNAENDIKSGEEISPVESRLEGGRISKDEQSSFENHLDDLGGRLEHLEKQLFGTGRVQGGFKWEIEFGQSRGKFEGAVRSPMVSRNSSVG